MLYLMNIERKVLYLYMLQQTMAYRNFDLILHFLLVYLIFQYSQYNLLVELVESKIG